MQNKYPPLKYPEDLRNVCTTNKGITKDFISKGIFFEKLKIKIVKYNIKAKKPNSATALNKLFVPSMKFNFCPFSKLI